MPTHAMNVEPRWRRLSLVSLTLTSGLTTATIHPPMSSTAVATNRHTVYYLFHTHTYLRHVHSCTSTCTHDLTHNTRTYTYTHAHIHAHTHARTHHSFMQRPVHRKGETCYGWVEMSLDGYKKKQKHYVCHTCL